MTAFEFTSVTRIVFGRGQFGKIGPIAAEFGQSALVVYNGGGDAPQRLASHLDSAGVRSEFYRQRGEPQTAHVDDALALARREQCDLVIGLGGGSAIDAAKAVAGLLGNGGAAIDYMEVIGRGRKITKPAAPWVAIPSTAGTGAEVTRNAVIGSPENKFKASLRSEHLLARVAVVDPELAVGVPADVTARCGMDALCQLIESYTSTGANPLTDALALRGIQLAARSLPVAYRNGSDLDAREAMAMAALLSGITLTNAGLGAVHGFAAPLGANFPIPHGTVCGVLLPLVIESNCAAMPPGHPGRVRYAQIGRVLFGDPSLPEEEAIGQCARFTSGLVRSFTLPSLAMFGVSESSIAEIVALAKKASSMRFNPVVLSDDVLGGILRDAIAG